MKKIEITPGGIKRNLKSFKPFEAVCEYIWNGFDAGADNIKIELRENKMGVVDELVIHDNGSGINYDELELRFCPFNESEKLMMAEKENHTIPHGRRGIGRLTFFSFAQEAKWETVFSKDSKNLSYYIRINKNSLNEFDDNAGKSPEESSQETGTKVTFYQVNGITYEELIISIKKEFFWFLELNKRKEFRIYVNGEIINYDDFVIDREIIDVSEKNLIYQYDIEVIQWNESLGKEYSRIYYIGSNEEEKYKDTTRLNRKADQFYHSVFIKSSYFDDFDFNKNNLEIQENLFASFRDDEFKTLIKTVEDILINKRKVFLKGFSQKYIKTLTEKKVYPYFNLKNDFEFYKKQQFDNLISVLYSAQPKIFTGLNDENKKITLNLLNVIIENGNNDDLFNILAQLIDLDQEEIKELSEVLKYTNLNNITKTIKLLKDRLKIIQELKALVFDPQLFAKEVPHIQAVLEEHFWILGEKYNLVAAAEADFRKALQSLIYKTTGIVESVDISHEDKHKEMDLYIIRQDRAGDVTENVVIELKRPTVNLGEKEVSQVKKYMSVIQSDPRFNAGNVKWTFFLIGNKFDTSGYIEGELENSSNLGEPFLIHKRDKGLTKIYVLKWSEVFDNYSKRHDFLMSRLNFDEKLWSDNDKSANEIVQDALSIQLQ